MSAAAPAELVRAAFAGNPARPALTYYDDATGERLELSFTSLDNWVAKTANLLQGDLAVSPGDTVVVALPAHWQTAAILLAAWSVGAVVVPLGLADPLPTGAEVVFCPGGRLAEALASGAGEAVGLSLAPMGARLGSVAPGGLDYAAEVPAQGDRFSAYAPVDPSGPALSTPTVDTRHTPARLAPTDDGRTWTGAELIEAARSGRGSGDSGRADGSGLTASDRVLSTVGWDDADGLLAGFLRPLVAGAGLVVCRNPDPAALARRAEVEKVTATVGVDLPGLPRLG